MAEHLNAIMRFVEILVLGSGIIITIWKIFRAGIRQTQDHFNTNMSALVSGQKKITREMELINRRYKKDLRFIKRELRRRVRIEVCEQLRAQCAQYRKEHLNDKKNIHCDDALRDCGMPECQQANCG